MRILLIDVNCKHSSTGKIAYNLFKQLQQEGHTAAVCYGRGKKIDEEGIYKFGIDFETVLHAVLTRITGLTGYFSYFSTRRLLKFIEQYEPDIIHIQELHAYFVNHITVINYLKKHNINTIWSFQCEYMYTGKCGHSYQCNSWIEGCGNCPNLKDYPKSILFDMTNKMWKDKEKAFRDFNSLTIVVPSKWSKERLMRSFLKNKPYMEIYNAIDSKNIFYPRPYEHLKQKHNIKDEKMVLAVAPSLMIDSKGGNYVVQLAKRMINRHVKFILIGIDKLNESFPTNVIALSRTNNQVELAEYYSMADVFVMCSKRETFSLTCAEALNCGTPVVGFKSGAPESIFFEPYGRFVEYANIDELEKAVEFTLNFDKFKLNCRDFAANRFSMETQYEHYCELYKSMLQNSVKNKE